MTEKDINMALEEVLANKDFKTKNNISKVDAYDLKNRSSVARKLKTLWQAGRLKLIDEPN